MKNLHESLNYDQLEILKFLNKEEEKKEKRINLLLGYSLMILIDLAIILPIALKYYFK